MNGDASLARSGWLVMIRAADSVNVGLMIPDLCSHTVGFRSRKESTGSCSLRELPTNQNSPLIEAVGTYLGG